MRSPTALDPHDARFVPAATGTLRIFNDAGLLTAADLHVSLRLAELADEHNELTQLGAAFAVREVGCARAVRPCDAHRDFPRIPA